jgi:hypothetical protein
MSAVFTQQMIIAQLGDPDGVLAAQVDAFWQAYSGVPGRSNFLVFLYTKRDAIQILMGSVRTRLADTNAEIARQEKIARASGGALSGVLTTTAPEAPPNVLGPDRNDSRYLGNPYRGRWPR